MSSKLTTYILPARHQLQYLMEFELPAGYYLDDLIFIAVAQMEVEYDHWAWEAIWDDLYNYAYILGGPHGGDEYSTKVRHQIAMEQASQAEAFIHAIIDVIKPHLMYVFGEKFLETNSIRSAMIGAGDLVLTYETCEPSVREHPIFTGGAFPYNRFT